MQGTTNDGQNVVPADGGESYSLMGGAEQATIKLSSDDTQGAYALVQVTLQPGAGQPPHIHHRMEETFYILDGEIEFTTNGETTRATKGSVVRIPKEALRGYRNSGSQPARALGLFVPGGFEGFLREMGQPGTSEAQSEGHVDFEKLVNTGAKYGLEIPPPNH